MKVQETKTITIDEKTYAVENFDESLRQMVTFMDEWRQKETDLTVDLTMVKSAIRDIQNSIYAAVKQAEVKAAAESEPVPDQAPAQQ